MCSGVLVTVYQSYSGPVVNNMHLAHGEEPDPPAVIINYPTLRRLSISSNLNYLYLYPLDKTCDPLTSTGEDADDNSNNHSNSPNNLGNEDVSASEYINKIGGRIHFTSDKESHGKKISEKIKGKKQSEIIKVLPPGIRWELSKLAGIRLLNLDQNGEFGLEDLQTCEESWVSLAFQVITPVALIVLIFHHLQNHWFGTGPCRRMSLFYE